MANNKIRINRIQEFKRLIPVRVITYTLNSPINVDLSTDLVGLVLDGVTLVNGDYIALFDQTTGSENGIYQVVTGAGNSVRRYDMPDSFESSSADFIVSEGSVGNSLFEITNPKGSSVVGTDVLTVTALGGSAAVSARNGLNVLSGVIEMGGPLIKDTTIGSSSDQFYYDLRNGDGGATFRNSFYMNSSQSNMSMHSWEYNHATMGDRTMGLGAIRAWGAFLRYGDTNSGNMNYIKMQDTLRIDIESDDALFEGLVYNSDISANFVDESLITKRYADNLVNGRSWKDPVTAMVDGSNVTGNIDLTSNLVGQTIDGVTLADGDRVALFDQTTGSENGIYDVITGAGNSVRSSGFSVGDEARNYTFFSSEGTANADITWSVTNDYGSDIVGTDTLVVAQTGSATQITAGAGMVRNGSAFDVVAADLSLLVNADDMQVNIGDTNGDSLEVSANGLELATTITGARTFEGVITMGSGATNFVLPNTRGTDGQVLKTDATGTVTWQDDGQTKISPQPEDVFTGDGATTTFLMTNLGTHATIKALYVEVYYEGQLLFGTVGAVGTNDYGYNADTGVVTMATAPLSADTIQIKHFSQDA